MSNGENELADLSKYSVNILENVAFKKTSNNHDLALETGREITKSN